MNRVKRLRHDQEQESRVPIWCQLFIPGMYICYEGCYEECGAVHILRGMRCIYSTKNVHMLRGEGLLTAVARSYSHN
jgi:hypothetical protein